MAGIYSVGFIVGYQHSLVFHIEASLLICTENHMIGFYIKCDTELKRVNFPLLTNLDIECFHLQITVYRNIKYFQR